MKKDIFNEYCSWLFDILDEVEKSIDTSNYDSYQSRVLGFLSERMLSIFVQYKIDTMPNLKLKRVKTIFINPNPLKEINFLVGKYTRFTDKICLQLLGLRFTKRIKRKDSN